MSEIFFTSDTHFGHKNILTYQPGSRPFSCIEEMAEHLVDRWNRMVNPNDKVYHLGDFCFGKKNIEIAARLNGHKRLILGNHDNYDVSEYLKYFEKVRGAFVWNGCILTHVPVHSDCLGERFKLNIHGHLHSNIVMRKQGNYRFTPHGERRFMVDHFYEDKPDTRYFNVGVDRHNLFPVSADTIMRDAHLIGLYQETIWKGST